MRGDRERLVDILEAIERIERYALRGEAAFRADELIRKLDDEATPGDRGSRRTLSQELRDSAPEVPWSSHRHSSYLSAPIF